MYPRPCSKTASSTCQNFASWGRISLWRAAARSCPAPACCMAGRSPFPTSARVRRSSWPPSPPGGPRFSRIFIISIAATRKSWASSRVWARTSHESTARRAMFVTTSPGSSGIESAVLSKKIGIDLGTSTVLVYVKGEGVVVNEPAVMATDEKGARVLAVGRAASEMVGRGRKARAVRLVRDGDGVDYNVAGAMLQHLIGRIVGRQRIFRPDVMLSVAAMVTGVERRAVLAATIQAGAKTAYLIDKPMAAAIGARVAVASTDGIAIVNLGAGSTELAVIGQGETLASESLAIGGDAFDRAIDAAIVTQRGVRLMPGEAERLKIQLGSASGPVPQSDLEVSAVDDGGGVREALLAQPVLRACDGAAVFASADAVGTLLGLSSVGRAFVFDDSPRELLRVFRRLRAGSVDTVVVPFPRRPLHVALAYFAGVPRRLIAPGGSGWAVTERVRGIKRLHPVEANWRVGAVASNRPVLTPGEAPALQPPEEVRSKAMARWPSFIGSGRRPLVMIPGGGGWSSRRSGGLWPAERWAVVANQSAADRIGILSGAGDDQTVRETTGRIPT